MMDERNTEGPTAIERKLGSVPPGPIVIDALAGAAAGAAVGVLAGPPGIIAGAVVGGAIGGVAAAALRLGQQEAERANEALDHDIGVIGGDIGEAPPDAPKSRLGVFHAASLGMGGAAGAVPSEGMMQNLDGD
ncbi:MAG: hypothetical protein QM820_03880 [Minicystis sp.]